MRSSTTTGSVSGFQCVPLEQDYIYRDVAVKKGWESKPQLNPSSSSLIRTSERGRAMDQEKNVLLDKAKRTMSTGEIPRVTWVGVSGIL